MAASDDGLLVLGMGNPLLDISAEVPPALFEKYELKAGNAILAEEKHLPLYAEMEKEFEVDYIAGGATQNSIRVAQWVLGRPGATAFIGCVGDDHFGSELAKAAAADGVATHYLKDADKPTGTCACLIHDSERSLVANLSAANEYKLDHLKTADIWKVVEAAKLYYMAGFFFTVSPPSIQAVAEHALATGKTLCLNLSAPFIVEFFADPLMAAMPYADFVFGNETEAEAFGKKQGYEDTSPAAVAQRIAALPTKGSRKRTVVITQGAKSTLVATAEGTTTYDVPPVPKAEIVDTNGAGDAFVGGFISQLALGKPVEECVRVGHACSATIIRTSGTKLPAEKPQF